MSTWQRAARMKPLDRVEIVARLSVLRDAIGALRLQAGRDHGGAFPCIGSMLRLAEEYEARLREIDSP